MKYIWTEVQILNPFLQSKLAESIINKNTAFCKTREMGGFQNATLSGYDYMEKDIG